ncbi:MAG: acetyl-CoA carboxylase biotin carboxyl carrier protein [Verrucomicrobiota bacterium]
MEGILDLKDIKAIIDLMKKNSISEFELERQDYKIRLKRGTVGPVVIAEDGQSPTVLSVSPTPLALPASIAPTSSGTAQIKSPMIGTLYRAPSPDAGNYVEIGTEVGPDTVVCLIEAMKVMNEIKAETRGVITEILSENAKAVEFGQPLFKIRPL